MQVLGAHWLPERQRGDGGRSRAGPAADSEGLAPAATGESPQIRRGCQWVPALRLRLRPGRQPSGRHGQAWHRRPRQITPERVKAFAGTIWQRGRPAPFPPLSPVGDISPSRGERVACGRLPATVSPGSIGCQFPAAAPPSGRHPGQGEAARCKSWGSIGCRSGSEEMAGGRVQVLPLTAKGSRPPRPARALTSAEGANGSRLSDCACGRDDSREDGKGRDTGGAEG
jgi:hypothetical protein